MLSQQRNKNLPGTATIALGDPSTIKVFNISLTEKQAKAIEDFFMYYPCDDPGKLSIEERLYLYFMEFLDGDTDANRSDYLFFVLLKTLLRSLEPISKQLNP